MSNPYFSPDSHALNVGIAMVTKNVNAALIFNHIFFWIKENKKKGINQHEGRTWMYESIPDITLHFPYLSEKQVKIALKDLVDHDYILKSNNPNDKWDKTNWYTISHDEWIDFKKMFAKGPTGPIDSACGADRSIPTGPIDQYLQGRCYKDKDNNTYNNTYREGDEPPPLPLPTKKSKKNNTELSKKTYRDKVHLTEEQYQKLLTQYGDHKLNWMMDYLDAKAGANGYTYESDYHVLLPAGWVHEAYNESLKKGKIERIPPTASNESSCRNKKICESAELALQQRFTATVFFNAGPGSAILVHGPKDFKKEYLYENYETMALKQLLLNDLEIVFPGAKNILSPQKQNKVTELMTNLTSQMRTQTQ